MVAACSTEEDTQSSVDLMCDVVKLAGRLKSAGLLTSMQEEQLMANGILRSRCKGTIEQVREFDQNDAY